MALFVLISPLSAEAAVDRAVVEGIGSGASSGQLGAVAHYMDGSTEVEIRNVFFAIGSISTEQAILDAASTAITSYASSQGYSLPNGIVWPYLSESQVQDLINAGATSLSPVASPLALSIQTSTGAVGTQVSTTSDSWVSVAGQVSTTATIAGSAAGDLIIEVAATNSASSTDWVEWGRIGNSQAVSLAVALQSVQVIKGQVMVLVPKNWYVKVRSAGSGTVSYTLNTVKKILLQ